MQGVREACGPLFPSPWLCTRISGSPEGPRRGADVETDAHTFWGCPANNNIEDAYVQDTQQLVSKAIVESAEYPCLWLR